MTQTENLIDHLPIAIRAYVPLANAERPRKPQKPPLPSYWVLTIDTETTIDPSQRLRFGSFQLRYAGKLAKHGLFYDAEALSKREQRILADIPRIPGRCEAMLVPSGVLSNGKSRATCAAGGQSRQLTAPTR